MFRLSRVFLITAAIAGCSDASGPAGTPTTRVAIANFGGSVPKVFDLAGTPTAIISCGTQCRIRTAEWSRRGDLLAMTANLGSASALFVAKSDGSAIRELAHVPATVLPGPKGTTQLLFHDFQPDWSSDDRLVYVNNGLIVSAADGTAQRTLLTGSALRPQWAAKDSAVTYINGTFFQLDIVRADGTGIRRLVTLPRDVTGQVWSPNGSKLAISTSSSGDGLLYVLDANTLNVREIAGVSYGDSHCWSPDSRSVTFIHAKRAPASNNEVTSAAIANIDGATITDLAISGVRCSYLFNVI